jgi:dolichol-phosphate mannosyltransferase
MNQPLIVARPGDLVPDLSIVVPTFRERDNVAPLVARLAAALDGIRWEAIFVDDDSPDGTIDAVRQIGARDGRVRAIRRVGRRGLAGACIEGMLSAQAAVVAVIDADLQHDETVLPQMLAQIRAGADLVVGTRYAAGGEASAFSARRSAMSRFATDLSKKFFTIRTSDPMSGFFMLRRNVIEAAAPRLSNQGFKILLDILLTSGSDIRIAEVPYSFSARQHGESKLDNQVLVDFVGLLLSKASGGLISIRFVLFGLVGVLGLFVHLLTLRIVLGAGGSFVLGQTAATIVAMTFNFVVNNFLTYRDQRLTGWAMVPGLLKFYAVCGLGAVGNVGVGSWVFHETARWWVAGVAGSVVGAIWNYLLSRSFVWKSKA